MLSIEAELEGYLGRGLRHGNLLQYLSIQHEHINNKINVEVDTPHTYPTCIFVCQYVIHVQVIMEYVGGGSVSNLLRNPDSGPVGGAVRREGGRRGRE